MSATQSSKAHIFLVEDEPDMRFIVESTLQKEYRVTSFGNGKDALSAFRNEQPDILLCDIILPGMSGDQLIMEVQRQYPDVAVVIITGIVDQSDHLAEIRKTVQGFLEKPFERTELIDTLNEIVAPA